VSCDWAGASDAPEAPDDNMGAIAPASAKRPAFTNSSRRFFLDMPASFHSTVTTSRHRRTKQVICHYTTPQGSFTSMNLQLQ
jgi:hypothetical protein